MSKLSTIAITLSVNAMLGAAFYLWQVKGIEQAGNVFIFYVWFIGVIGSMLIFSTPTANDYQPRTAVNNLSRFICSPLILIGTLWAGHIFAATVYAIAILAAHARRAKAKELAGVTCQK